MQAFLVKEVWMSTSVKLPGKYVWPRHILFITGFVRVLEILENA